MPPKSAEELYHDYYVSQDDSRLQLFQLLAEQHAIESALYPGSYVDVTPSFVYPITVYVDTDRRAKRFFADPRTYDLIARHKRYDDDPQVAYYAADYAADFGAQEGSFDLLISLYAGFVSQPCKRYLKVGGLLLANNSHGDASMASIDDDYQFIAAVTRRSGSYRVSTENLDAYFVPKSEVDVTREYLYDLQRGIGYKRSASAYLFRRTR